MKQTQEIGPVVGRKNVLPLPRHLLLHPVNVPGNLSLHVHIVLCPQAEIEHHTEVPRVVVA